MADMTPTFIAYCPECSGLIAASVADLDDPAQLIQAAKDRQQWERAGLRVETKTVQDVRDHKPPLGHVATCSRRRPKLGQQAGLL